MLLFHNEDKKEQDDQLAAVVISSRQDVMDSVCEQLEVRKVNTISRFELNLESFNAAEIVENTKYIIFFVEQHTDIERFMEKSEFLFPKNVVCIAIGSCDSILLAEKFQTYGIFYIYYPDQLTKLGHILDNELEHPKWARSSLKISVLGCKGGVGTSSLSYHLATSIVSHRNASLLLVQGAGGTQDLDLIAKSEISNEVVKLQDNLFALYEEHDHAWSYTMPLYDTYDFVLFDHASYNSRPEDIENVLSHSNCVLLICNRSLSSIRNAKKVIAYNQHLQKSNNGVKEIIICFNDNMPKFNSAITKDEAGRLIGQPIDITIPFISNSGDPSQPLSFSGKNKYFLEELKNITLGIKEQKKKKNGMASLFNLAGKKS